MLRDKILFLALFLLTLNSCSLFSNIFGNGEISGEAGLPTLPDPKYESKNPKLTHKQLTFIREQCISDLFREKDKNNLYGKECLEGRSLVIEVLKEGANIISTSAVTGTEEENSGPAVELEGPPDFINQVYKASYKILKDKGDNRNYSFLTDLFPLGKEFNASFKDGTHKTRYRIIFKVEGNYLVLYKASKDLKDIPYIERSSIPFDKKTKQYQLDENGFYKVPFLGWLIEHCTTDHDYSDTGERLSIKIPVCGSSNDRAKLGKYIKIESSVPELYSYQIKKDLFPTNYFDGKWFFSSGRIEGQNSGGTTDKIAPKKAYFVTLDKQNNSLKAIDQSGDIALSDRQTLVSFPVKWVEYEPDKIGGGIFKSFGEKLEESREDEINTNLMIFDFDNFYIEDEDGNKEKAEVVELLISDNYFSFVAKADWTPVNTWGEKQRDRDKNLIKYTVRYRFSLLRANFLDQEGFKPKKLFLEDDDHIFGTLYVAPQDIRTLGERSESENNAHKRSIRFNTSLNTEEEKESKTKVIKWYFSKNSTKDQKYRDIAHRAIEIYNRAFEIITKGSNQKIKVELVGDIEDDKELGDMRYNIINLVQTDQIGRGGDFFGIAPSYVHSNTGQIIGTTSNVIVHDIEDVYIDNVGRYVRYEIFYKDATKQPDETFKTHLVTPYFANKIASEPDCKPVMDFITETKNKNLSPDTELKDTKIRVTCGKKLAADEILFTLLHELGHNFGLGHNFKGSIDKANYYKTIEEIKKLFLKVPENISITKSSTVMEYLPAAEVPSMVYLGKYDLAALRYIYMDQVEKKPSSNEDDVKFLNLNIPQDPAQQTPIPDSIKRQMKPYQHCSTDVAFKTRLNEDFHCIIFDYGSTPKETVQFYIDRFKRAFNIYRYRYDVDRMPSFSLILQQREGITSLKEIKLFYKEWLKLRDHYLKYTASPDILTYDVSNPNSTQRYIETINQVLNSYKDSDYALYYPVRDLISDFLMNFLFLESMQCLIKDKDLQQERFINLKSVISVLIPFLGSKGIHTYVKDCDSPDIKSFFEDPTFFEDRKYEINGQKGFENFTTYKNFPSVNTKNSKWNINAIKDILNIIEYETTLYDGTTTRAIDKYLFFVDEPDLLDKFRIRLQNNLLDDRDGFSEMEYHRDISLYRHLMRIFIELRDSRQQNIGQNNINYFLSRKFAYGTEDDSFNHLVEQPLLEGSSIELVAEAIPFLSFAYRQYRDYLKREEGDESTEAAAREEGDESAEERAVILGFRKWMCENLDQVLCSAEERSITVPFDSQNFSVKLIKKYNDLKARKEELIGRGVSNLTIFEHIDLNHLESRMENIYEAISIMRQNDENSLLSKKD